MLNELMRTSDAQVLAFVGVGAMGEGMCRNLARKSGAKVLAVDLDPENLRRLEPDDVVASSLADVRSAAHTVFLSLPSIKQVEMVCLDGPEPLAGKGGSVKIIVDMSTSDAVRTRALAARLATVGVLLVDAPVARSREAAHEGTLLITVGGEKGDFDAVRPLLACMGSDVVHCGPVGSGQVAKILNNMVVLSTTGLLAEAMAIGSAAGVDRGMLINVLQLGSADSFALRIVGKYLAQNDFPEKLFPTTYALKDLRLALDMAASTGVHAAMVTCAADRLEQAVAQGYGMHYHPVVYRLIEAPNRANA